jgi:hypothetical protein
VLRIASETPTTQSAQLKGLSRGGFDLLRPFLMQGNQQWRRRAKPRWLQEKVSDGDAIFVD